MSVVPDQAQSLRDLMNASVPPVVAVRAPVPRPAAPRRARIVAVASGKGGVGKTNVAVNLAYCLSMAGRRVLLMDADMGTANADVLCDLIPNGTLAHVVAGRRTLRQIMLKGPGGFALIPGTSGLANMAALGEAQLRTLMRQLQSFEKEVDLILLDTGAGVSPNVLSFVQRADQLLVVTTPEPPAITDAYAMIKVVARKDPHPQVLVVVNQVHDLAEARGVFARVDATCRRFLDLGIRFAGHVVHDRRVTTAVRRRRPFTLDCPSAAASVCIRELADRINGQMSRTGSAGQRAGMRRSVRP